MSLKKVQCFIILSLLFASFGCTVREGSVNNTNNVGSMTNKKADTKNNARDALLKFFTLLAEKNYKEAVNYYGGSYKSLRNWNPTVSKNDLSTLLKNGCEINGLQCLPVRKIINEKQITSNEYKFTIQFMGTNGGIFVQGPFEGETQTPPSEFTYTVIKENRRFLVTDLPPYIP